MVGGDAAGGDGEAVEGDIPDEFAPLGASEGVGGVAGDSGGLEGVGDLPGECAVGGWLVFTDGDFSAGGVADVAWGDAVDANKAEAAENGVLREELGELLDVAEAVLQGEKACFGADQWGEDTLVMGVGGGFPRDDDPINRADIGCVIKRLNFG